MYRKGRDHIIIEGGPPEMEVKLYLWSGHVYLASLTKEQQNIENNKNTNTEGGASF